MTKHDPKMFELPSERVRELNALVHILRYAERECATLSPTARDLIEQAADELDSMRATH